jgi:hydrogenase maturation protease
MAQVKKAPPEEWKTKLDEIKKKGSPIFIGVGRKDRSDDGAGLELACKLIKLGKGDVYLESELDENEMPWREGNNRPLIFLDALDFRERPGKVILIPLHYLFSNSSLSHRLLPFFPAKMSYKQLKNSFVLGIQPESIEEGRKISRPVRKTLAKVLEQITN